MDYEEAEEEEEDFCEEDYGDGTEDEEDAEDGFTRGAEDAYGE